LPRRANPWRDLATEQTHPRSERLDRLGVRRVIALMQAEDRCVLAALRSARPAIESAAEAFRQTFREGGTCFFFGAGTSGRLAVLEAAELPPTFGTDPRRVRAVVAGGRRAVFRAREGAEDRLGDGRRAGSRCRAGDLAVGVSASSVTPFVRGALEAARAGGALTALVTSGAGPGLHSLADIVVRLPVGPEVVAGSTRLKAGTATKLALNQVTTAALASSGKVFGPWMVDLRAGSAKLKARAVRIVAAASDIPASRARRLLAQAGGEVKTAILVGRLGVPVKRARTLLNQAGGDLRSALSAAAAASKRGVSG
jgi:N-acetylmuramic acid 6-phosphate etherase